MKKLFPFLLVLFVVQSCEEPVEITETMVVNQSTIVTINQTNGTSVSFNDVIEGDLNQVVSNFNSITDITIDSLTYSFSNLIGNENASIVSASIEINGITVAVVSDLNIAQEIDNESVFQITDLNVLDQLETSFLNNSSVALNLSGMALSEEGDVSFEIGVSMQLTASF
jgi:DNA polymerase III epsilon subunit-like protein